MFAEQADALARIGEVIRMRSSAVVAADDASYVEDMFTDRVAAVLGVRIRVLPPGALEDQGPAFATDSPEATRDRLAWAAKGVDDPFAPEHAPQELAVYLGPPWEEAQQHYEVLVFHGVHGSSPGEADDLNALIARRELRSRKLRDDVALIAILDARWWDKYAVEGFAHGAGADLIRWPGLGLTDRDSLAVARGGDPFAHLDFDQLLPAGSRGT